MVRQVDLPLICFWAGGGLGGRKLAPHGREGHCGRAGKFFWHYGGVLRGEDKEECIIIFVYKDRN